MLLYVNTSPVKFNGDLLIRLLWDDRHISKKHELGLVCLKFDYNVRKRMAPFILQAVGMVCTTFSMLKPSNPTQQINLTLQDVKNSLDVFISKHCNTETIPDQSIATN